MLHNEKNKEWEQRIEEFQQSGLNMRRWCREQQIPYERMKYWKNRLKEHTALTSSAPTKAASSTWVKVPSVPEKKVLQSSPAAGNLAYISVKSWLRCLPDSMQLPCGKFFRPCRLHGRGQRNRHRLSGLRRNRYAQSD